MQNNIFTSIPKTWKIALGIIVLILLAITISYFSGYRFSGFSVVRQGTLTIEGLPSETDIYLDNALKGRFEGKAVLKANPGEHDVIISKAGYWPYLEKIIFKKDRTEKLVALKPFLIPQNPEGKLIGSNDPEYLKAISLFNQRAVPLKNSKLLSPNGLVSIYVDDGKIFAVNESGGDTTLSIFKDPIYKEVQVFDPVTEVRNLAFYKDRDDVIIIAIQDGIFVLELDPTTVQNLQPILEGEAPTFRISSEGTFYAKDKNLLMKIEL